MTMQRLQSLRKLMQQGNLSAILVTNAENRFYLSGFTGSSGTLLITQEDAILVASFVYQEQAALQAVGYTIVPATSAVGHTAVVAELLKQHGINRIGYEVNHVTVAQLQSFEESFIEADLDVTTVPYKDLIESIRQVKDADELALMGKASMISDQAYLNVLNFIRAGVSERDVALEIEFTMKRLGAENVAFSTIVVSGKRSSMPHGKPTDKLLQPGDFVTMDFGAKYMGYCSDITRTVIIGKPSDEQRIVYQTVLQAHMRALNAASAGITGKELDAVARDTISDAGYGNYFGHGLGHGVGLQVHEQPGAGQKSESELVAGNVVTIEPGIYIPNWGGVRIEDTVLITEDGHRSMHHTTKELIVL